MIRKQNPKSNEYAQQLIYEWSNYTEFWNYTSINSRESVTYYYPNKLNPETLKIRIYSSSGEQICCLEKLNSKEYELKPGNILYFNGRPYTGKLGNYTFENGKLKS